MLWIYFLQEYIQKKKDLYLSYYRMLLIVLIHMSKLH